MYDCQRTSNLFITILYICCCLVTLFSFSTAQKTKNDFGITGIDILKTQMNIKRISAHYNFKENKAYYMVKFCGKKKKQPLCFVTNMVEKGEEKQANGDEIGVVRNINLWMKLISTLNGKNNYNIHPAPELKYLEEHSRCQGTHYFISKGPNKKIIDEIIRDSKLKKKKNSQCSSGKEPRCHRICLRGEYEKCDEIRLLCFFDRCKCYKNVDLSNLRVKSKSKQNRP